MERFNENDPLQMWIDNDAKLSQILKEIDILAYSEKEQAKKLFYRLAEEYNLPKYPDDVDTRETKIVADFHLYESISMYEVLGKLKFVNNNYDEIKSNVLFAAYLVKNKYEPIIDEELDEFLGEEDLWGFGYKGEDIEVEMIPIKVGENQADLGYTYFIKEV